MLSGHIRFRKSQCALDKLARPVSQPVPDAYFSRGFMPHIDQRSIYGNGKIRHCVNQGAIQIKDDALIASGRLGKAGRRQAQFPYEGRE